MAAVSDGKADLRGLTSIRGMAAWLVVLFHIRGSFQSQVPALLMAVFDKGYLAVDLFFVLSGFVLWLNYSMRLRTGGASAIPSFLGARIARIWPLHAAILACMAAFALLLYLLGHSRSEQYPWSQLPLHLLLVQNWGFTRSLSWNDPAWSISCELAAYLLFPLLALAVDWRRFSVGALLALIAGFALVLHFTMWAGGAETLGTDIPRFGLIRALCEFTMGTLTCALWQRSLSTPRQAAFLSVAGGAVIALGMLAGGVPETLGIPLLVVSILMSVGLAETRTTNPLAWRVPHYLGEISYATYLAHFPLFILFKILFVDDVTRVPLILVAFFLILTLAVSVALHHGLERPAQRLLNRWFASKLLAIARRPRQT